MTIPGLTADADRLRHQLGLPYSDTSVELRKRNRASARERTPTPVPLPGVISRVRSELPLAALQGAGLLALRLRELTGRDVIDLATMLAIVQWFSRQSELASREEAAVDDFGFDREWTESLLPIFEWMYHRYWRVDTTGVANVPREGRGLLVANHAGVLPWDGAMIKTALFTEAPHIRRHARALVDQFFFGLPWLSWFLRRTGQTVGRAEDSVRLLDRDELVLVFPEGTKGTGKPWSERYRLRRFGRGGFVQVAIRSGSPIIPISVVGSEEIYPMLGNLEPVARLTGFPYFPVTPFFPWLGLLGAVPLPSKWRIQFHDPVRTDQLPPEAADDQSVVMSISDQVRSTIQDGILENLKLRRGAFY
jgi:1-acyl-sn-glycerol-3-phosphate acyltransferase